MSLLLVLRKCSWVWLLFLILTLSLLTSSAIASQQVALVIGNSQYQHVEALQNTKYDAEGVAGKLESVGFDVIKLLDASVDQQRNAITVFRERLKQSDVGLFFYAGHGIAINGSNYMIPVDASLTTKNAADLELVKVDSVVSGFDGSKQKLLVFLDACRNNPFIERVSALSGVEVSRGLALSKKIKMSTEKGLSRLESGNQNLFVAFATQPGNFAVDGIAGETNSPFSKALIDQMDQKLEVRELMTRVRASVAEKTNYKQIPWEQNSLLEPVFLAGFPDTKKIQTLQVGTVESVNTAWGFVVAKMVGDKRPDLGDTVKIELGERTIDATVKKVKDSKMSLAPSTWNYPIDQGAKVSKEFVYN